MSSIISTEARRSCLGKFRGLTKDSGPFLFLNMSVYAFSSDVSLEASVRLRLAGRARSEDPWVIVVEWGGLSS